MLPSETMIWQPEFTDKTLSRKPGAVHVRIPLYSITVWPNRDRFRCHFASTHDPEGKHLTTWYQQISLRAHSYKNTQQKQDNSKRKFNISH
ncbi:hypothetical protein [Escherichia coli]|uniref:hypothetical protein n=1 Tax=Escherichia coli TaxID=562 RepID=UPI000BEAE3A1|nr:hypothetical protein [Escherichia coli]